MFNQDTCCMYLIDLTESVSWKYFWHKPLECKLCLHAVSGCGSVGRSFASYTRRPRFKSSHYQNVLIKICCWNDENKETKRWGCGGGQVVNENKQKRGRGWPIFLRNKEAGNVQFQKYWLYMQYIMWHHDDPVQGSKCCQILGKFNPMNCQRL